MLCKYFTFTQIYWGYMLKCHLCTDFFIEIERFLMIVILKTFCLENGGHTFSSLFFIEIERFHIILILILRLQKAVGLIMFGPLNHGSVAMIGEATGMSSKYTLCILKCFP